MMISFILLPGKIPWRKAEIFLLGLVNFCAYSKYDVNLLPRIALIKLPLILTAMQQHSLLCVVRCQQLCYRC